MLLLLLLSPLLPFAKAPPPPPAQLRRLLPGRAPPEPGEPAPPAQQRLPQHRPRRRPLTGLPACSKATPLGAVAALGFNFLPQPDWDLEGKAGVTLSGGQLASGELMSHTNSGAVEEASAKEGEIVISEGMLRKVTCCCLVVFQ